ncbi:MAG TPA: Gfo/Idh/MocA family oxidoreductase [Opitutaceae bacterium]|jgi:predicted dehydrogenase
MSDLPPLDRRQFISKTAAAGLAAGLLRKLPSFARAASQPGSASPNSRLRVAVVGTNGRGLAHIQCLGGVDNAEIVYICDVDDRAIAKGLAETAKWQRTVPQGIKDFRRSLEDPSIDAITIATPDHWHTPMSILAMAAGKHVYVEKPCSQNPHEGELLLAAVKASGRLVQMGNQRRSFPAMKEAVKLIHDGAIGRAYFAKAWYANGRAALPPLTPAPVPSWLDYDLWQGPAPRRPYRTNLIHYNWHWFWHWGTGEALNNGTHEVDVCRWALDVNYPLRVASIGGRYQFKDQWETPDTQTIGWDFPEGKSLSWEGRSCNPRPVEGRQRGAMIYGTEGSALLDGLEYTIYDRKDRIVREVKSAGQKDTTNILSSTGAAADTLHFRNFADAVRQGTPLNSSIEIANPSVNLLHLGNIAWRVGRELHCDTSNGHILGDADAMKLWQRTYEPGWEPKV